MNTLFSVILLAAGSGLRMGTDTRKQYIDVGGYPLIYYPLKVFEESGAGEIILVVPPGDCDYVRRDIVEKYHIKNVTKIVEGGAERYLSVYEGLKQVTLPYVLVHDGARACITKEVIQDVVKASEEYKACEAAIMSVDTVKIADEEGFVKMTPPRQQVWSIQTPQGFETKLLRDAYRIVFEKELTAGLTDDAMLVERAFPERRIRLVMGDDRNIKVTTPKDLPIVERILSDVKCDESYGHGL